jgi:hypothetical protein
MVAGDTAVPAIDAAGYLGKGCTSLDEPGKMPALPVAISR